MWLQQNSKTQNICRTFLKTFCFVLLLTMALLGVIRYIALTFTPKQTEFACFDVKNAVDLLNFCGELFLCINVLKSPYHII